MSARGERAGVLEGDGWTVTLWRRGTDAEPAARIIGIEKRDTALLTAARALAGADLTVPRCEVARVEGWDRRLGDCRWTLRAE